MLATVAVLVILIFVNLLNNKWAKRHYLLVCLIATAVLLAIARIDGITWTQLGLARSTWEKGLIWSVIVVGAVALFYAVVASLPFTRAAFADKRAAEGGWFSVIYHSVLRIPFGTALLEETAFRGVLLAVVGETWGVTVGVVVSSVVFGLWHVLPALDFHDSHDAAARFGDGKKAKASSVVLTVLGTGAAGIGFCVLRLWSDSLFAPIALHAALNGIGFAVSWGLARRLRDL